MQGRTIVRREDSFFRGSELSRLLVLAAVVVIGWSLFWKFGRSRPPAPEPRVRAEDHSGPIVPDRSIEFESVTDRAPMKLGDNAAYKRLVEKSRSLTPAELAGVSRRDVVMADLWERPEHYRGVPIHLDGTANRVRRYESVFSETGRLYEAWITTPDSGRFGYICVFETPPKGFPVGANLNERVVFNGYFLKIWKYDAADVPRGAPLLIGRIGWDAGLSSGGQALGSGSTLNWTLILLGCMIVITLIRWLVSLGRSMGRRGTLPARYSSPTDQIDAASLEHWVRNVGEVEESARRTDGEDGPATMSDPAPAGPSVEGGGEERVTPEGSRPNDLNR